MRGAIPALCAQSDPPSLRGCDVAASIECRAGDALGTVIDRQPPEPVEMLRA
jgi:hypothetical protein